MTPLDKEVAEFMRSLNFRYDGTVGVWLIIGLPPVKHEVATFFYTAYLKGKIEALEDIPFTDREHGCMSCTATSIVGNEIKQLEAQLNQTKPEKGYKDGK